jgi:two-component system LytT family response regulator
MKIKAIIIDDELHSLQSTQLLVEQYCPAVEIIGTAASAKEGLSMIETLNPDLVFLDIAMPVMNGLELLTKIRERNFEVIFTTAYDEYAIKAIRVNALDYLLKPIEPDELKEAVAKVVQKRQKRYDPDKIDELLGKISDVPHKEKKLALSVDGRIQMIEPDDIIYCESDSNYTTIFLTGNKKRMLSKTLKEVETILNRPRFFRCQNSFLINLNHVKEYFRGEGGEVIMSDGKMIRVSRNKKEELLRLLTK